MSIEKHFFGTHSVVREHVDTFVFHVSGLFTKQEMKDIAAIERRAWEIDHVTHLYLLAILDENASISPGVITDAVMMFRDAPASSAAIVTASFTVRTTMEFFARMSRAARMKTRLRLFAREDEARIWLNAEREGR